MTRSLQQEVHFSINEKDHTVNLTDEGIRQAEKLAGVESFYTAGNMEWPHLIDNALKAHHLYKRDVNYVVKDGEIVIVDEFTGRLMEGRQWSDGLHQAVEAKEGVRIKEETQTLATITLQNFFKLYKKISGMTGTAMTEANEFWKIYGLDVIAVPTNRGLKRIEHADVIYLTEKEKFDAVAEDVERTHRWDCVVTTDGNRHYGEVVSDNDQEVSVKDKDSRQVESIPRSKIQTVIPKGRPVLVGTVSIEKSEKLSHMLDRRGVKHQVLNAKNHGREAEIIAQAGRMNSVTIATNMAGRGTDIILGGNPETMAWARLQGTYPTRLDVPRDVWDSLVHEIDQSEKMREEGVHVREIGGLYVIGTERHESRRIDLQLRGRCGRQGDPGSSRFYLSLEDDLMRIFAGDWVRAMMGKLGMGNGEPIESSFVSRRISAAQKKVEERNFDIRKNLLEYDEVMDQQRKRVYGYRQRILDGVSCRELVVEQLRQQIQHNVSQFTDPMFGAESYARWAGQQLSCQLDAKDFRTTDPSTASYYAKEMAERSAETQILDAVDENLPPEEEQSEWNWEALTNWCNTRFGTTFKVSDLKKVDRDRVDEVMINAAREKLNSVDLSAGSPFLSEEYGIRMLCDWMRNKFAIQVDPTRIQDKEPKQILEALLNEAENAYRAREIEYPIMVGFTRFKTPSQGDNYELDGNALLQWATVRFGSQVQLPSQEITTEDLYRALAETSKKSEQMAQQAIAEGKERLADLYAGSNATSSLRSLTQANGRLESFHKWLEELTGQPVDLEPWMNLDEAGIRNKIAQTIDDRYFPEIRRMERQVILTIVDEAWKGHLLAMDHLRSAIGLKGYAQMDPKVEYKREGMKLFEQMWFAFGERITDIIFRMEGLSEDFVGSTWVETSARHDAASTTSDLIRQKEEDLSAADAAGREATSPEPIRNRSDRVGRNDACPCGSGKKYKNCCMRRQV